MKKYIGPAVGGSVVIILVTIFLLVAPVNIFKAVPKTAIAIIETNDWSQLNQQLGATPAGTRLKNTLVIKKLTGEIEAMQQLLSGNKTMEAKVISSKIIASLHLTSAGDFDFLFTIPVSGVDDNSVLQQIKNSKNIRTINIRMFHNQKVIDIGLADGRQITFADLKGIFAFSFTSFLTENSITGLVSGNNVENDKEFKIVQKKFLPNGDLSVFFNFHETGIILPVFMKMQLTPLLKDVSNFASWGAYNISLSNGAIKIDGIAHSTEKNIQARAILAASDTVLANIPDNAAYVNLSAFENAPDKFFKGWPGSSHAFVTLEPLKQDFSDENLFIISLSDKDKAYNSLKKLAAANGSGNPVDMPGVIPIYNLKDGAILNRVFGGNFTQFGNSYFALTDNIAIFGNTIDALKFALDKISRGETLNKTADFKSSAGSSNSYIYIDPQRAALMIRGLMQPGSSVPNFFGQFDATSIQTSWHDGWLSTSTALKLNGGAKTPGGLLWKTALKAPAAIAPQIVTNSNTGEKEIFIEDTLNNLYLLDKSGEILFTTPIDEKILGAVYQLDYYNNGKLQYIFNTSGHVYIVDRLGNFVSSYPIRLSHAASAGLTLTQDSITGIYSYYVPCENGSVYGYESTGRPLPGWSPRNGLGLISKPLQSIWYNNNIYLLAYNDEGKLMLLDRRGSIKWLVDKLPPANQSFSIIRQQDSFVLLNAAGKEMITISPDGSNNVTPLIDSAPCFTAVATSDTSYLYFFSNASQVRSYDNRNVFQKSLGLKAANITSLSLSEIGDSKFLIIEDEASKQALVYDLELNPVAEYAIETTGLFQITNLLGGEDLIGLQGENGSLLSCYRLK